MTTEKKHGGSRANSGRKLKHGEKTVLVRIPASWQNDLTRCLFEGINPFEFVQNQDAEKDRLISELSAKLEIVQNQVCASDEEVARLSSELSAYHCSLEFVQNQDAEKDRLISELSAKLETVQNQVEKVQNQDDRIKPIEPARQSTAKPARTVDNEIKKTFLQQANELHLKNIELSKSEIARVLSEQFDVRFETARDWLKKEWKSK